MKKNTPLRKILRLCRLNQGNVSKLVARKKSTQEKLDLLLVTKERSNLDERTLLEHKESIRQRASTLSKEKIQTEIDVRKYQCEILRHRLTLLKSPSEDEANLVQTAITELENICQQLEAKLKSTQHEIQEFELQASTCLQQHKEITDSNAGIEQLISITQSEMDDDESRLSALRKERIILQERLRRAISEERSRIKIATTVQRAKAACDYKKRLLLLQEKERKRLRNLDRLLNDCNIET